MRLLHTLLLLLLFSTALSGCNAPSNERQANGSSVAIQQFPSDDLGRPINLQKPAERVVCIGPGATETIFALGAGSKLVGRDQVSDYPKEATELPIIGDFTGPFPEKVVALRPDLVIIQGETYDKARVENWQEKMGVPVAALVPTSTQTVAEGFVKIGQWLGRAEQAEELASHLMAEADVAFRAGDSSTFFEVQRSPSWTAGEGTLVDDLLKRGGFTNAFAVIVSYKQINRETLLSRQPEYYVVSSGKPESFRQGKRDVIQERARVLKELRRDPVLRNLKCIEEGRVVVVPGDWLMRPGPRLQDGIRELIEQHQELGKTL